MTLSAHFGWLIAGASLPQGLSRSEHNGNQQCPLKGLNFALLLGCITIKDPLVDLAAARKQARIAATGKDTSYPAGEPVGLIIELENGFKIYHMGDTGLFGDMKFISEYYKPDPLLIPIGGHYVMSPKDAAYATKEWIKPKMALPMHYGTNPYLKGTPAEYKAALGQTTVEVLDMKPGDTKSF